MKSQKFVMLSLKGGMDKDILDPVVQANLLQSANLPNIKRLTSTNQPIEGRRADPSLLSDPGEDAASQLDSPANKLTNPDKIVTNQLTNSPANQSTP